MKTKFLLLLAFVGIVTAAIFSDPHGPSAGRAPENRDNRQAFCL